MLTGFSITQPQLAKQCQFVWLRALWVLSACLFLPAITYAVNSNPPLSFTPIPGDPFRDPAILAELAALEATVDDTDLMFEADLALRNQPREWEYMLKPDEKQTPINDLRYYDNRDQLTWGHFTLTKQPASETGREAVELFRQLAQGRGGEWPRIIQRLERAQSENDHISGALLGWCFLYGLGVVQSDAQAFAYFRRAVKAGEPSGHYDLGRLVTLGRIDAFEAGMKEAERIRASGEEAQELEERNKQHKKNEKTFRKSWLKQGRNQKRSNDNSPRFIPPQPKNPLSSVLTLPLAMGSKRDKPEELKELVSYHHYRKAANQGQAQASYAIAYGYIYGWPQSQFPSLDLKRGWEWMEKAAMYQLYLAYSGSLSTARMKR